MINGIGTRLYGKKYISYKELKKLGIIKRSPKKAKFKPYIATKWFVIFFLPILPLGSHIVLGEEGIDVGFLVDKEYWLVKTKLNVEQVINGYLITFIVILFLFLMIRNFL